MHLQTYAYHSFFNINIVWGTGVDHSALISTTDGLITFCQDCSRIRPNFLIVMFYTRFYIIYMTGYNTALKLRLDIRQYSLVLSIIRNRYGFPCNEVEELYDYVDHHFAAHPLYCMYIDPARTAKFKS